MEDVIYIARLSGKVVGGVNMMNDHFKFDEESKNEKGCMEAIEK